MSKIFMNKTICLKKNLKIIVSIFLSFHLFCMANELPEDIFKEIEAIKQAYRKKLYDLYYNYDGFSYTKKPEGSLEERHNLYVVASAFDRLKYINENIGRMSKEDQQKIKSVLMN